MTVIAYDGTILAADRASSFGDLSLKSAGKIVEYESLLLVGCGDASRCRELIAIISKNWPDHSAINAAWPDYAKTDEPKQSVVLVPRYSKRCYFFDSCGYPIELVPPVAFGCGMMFAQAAMLCGKTATEAVELACQHVNYCGQGVDSVKV